MAFKGSKHVLFTSTNITELSSFSLQKCKLSLVGDLRVWYDSALPAPSTDHGKKMFLVIYSLLPCILPNLPELTMCTVSLCQQCFFFFKFNTHQHTQGHNIFTKHLSEGALSPFDSYRGIKKQDKLHWLVKTYITGRASTLSGHYSSRAQYMSLCHFWKVTPRWSCCWRTKDSNAVPRIVFHGGFLFAGGLLVKEIALIGC